MLGKVNRDGELLSSGANRVAILALDNSINITQIRTHVRGLLCCIPMTYGAIRVV